MVPVKRTRLPPLSISQFSLISSPNIPSRPAPVICPCINIHRKEPKINFCCTWIYWVSQEQTPDAHLVVDTLDKYLETSATPEYWTGLVQLYDGLTPRIAQPQYAHLVCNVCERKDRTGRNQYKSESWISMDNHHYRRWNWAPDGSDNANHQWWRAPLNVQLYYVLLCTRTHVLSGYFRFWGSALAITVEAEKPAVVTCAVLHSCQGTRSAKTLFYFNQRCHHHHLSFFFARWCGHHLIQN